MKLIGFSRKKLNDEIALRAIMHVIEPYFGKESFSFSMECDSDEMREFNFKEGLKKLQRENSLGFFKENEVAVIIDNQAYNNEYFTYPHCSVEIQFIEEQKSAGCSIQLKDWLEMAKNLVDTAGVDLAIVLGENENLADYWRTPLGVRIGLSKVFWIMCFGESYSRLISDNRQPTSFHSREEFNNGTAKAFVSASSFDSYLTLEPQMQASQKIEIGQDLFNRLPVEKQRGGESGWLFNPKKILRFLVFLFRQKTTNWRKYQAKVVPKN
jgi:hypothetical protein